MIYQRFLTQPASRFSALALLLVLFVRQVEAGLNTNWNFVTPLPQGNDLLAAWAAAPDDLFVGGPGGVIMRWNGTNWARMTTPTTKTIHSLHGLSNRDVWAVGGDSYTLDQTNRSLVMHWDGQHWTEMSPPNFSSWTYPFNAVHAVGPKDVWGVVEGGTFPVHYDGKNWEFISLPLSLEGNFKTITSVTSNHVFFAGTHGQIVHLEEGNWVLEQKTESGSFSFNLLQTLWAWDPSTVYAGGNLGQVYRRNPSGVWTDLGLGGGLFDGITVLKIHGTSPSNLYFLGIQSVRHFNGNVTTWTNDFSSEMRLQWFSGAGTSNRIFGVGPGGVAHEFLTDGPDGGTLSSLTVGGDASLSLTPKGAVSCGTNGLLVYGSSLYRPNTHPMLYFDGFNYHNFPQLPPAMPAECMVNAAWAGSLQDVVVAWDSFLSFERGVHRWNGTSWEAMGTAWNQPHDAVGFWRSPAGKLYACTGWRVMHWDGTSEWAQLYSVPEPDMQQMVLSTIWGRSDTEIYIGSRNGRILRFDGTTWKTETTPPGGGVIHRISGNATEAYAVGEDALVWRRVGSSWQRLLGINQRDGEHFTHALAGTDGVYAVQQTPPGYTGGGLGLLWRLNGATPTVVIKGLSQPIEMIAQTRGHLYCLGAQSFILSDQAVPDNATQHWMDFSSTNWSSLGTSGVELRSPSIIPNRTMVAAIRADESSTFLSDALPGAQGATQHWIVRAEMFNRGEALPPVFLRLHYDPARLPAGFTTANACLFHYRAGSWTVVPSSIDLADHTITSQVPAGSGEWTLGTMPVMEAPTLSIQLSAAGQIVISWPATSSEWQLEGTASLDEGSWSPVTHGPTVRDGANQVILPSVSTQFYRLRGQ